MLRMLEDFGERGPKTLIGQPRLQFGGLPPRLAATWAAGKCQDGGLIPVLIC